MSDTFNIKKITSILSILRVLRMSMSVVILIFSAKYFGVSMERDVWILVTTFLMTICSAVWGPVNETFRVKFVFIREQEGEQVALQKAASLVGFIIVVTVLLSVCVLLFLHPITSFFMQYPTDEGIRVFVSLLLIMLPSFLINELISIGISILNAYEVYYVPEIVGAVSSLLNIVVIVCLAPLLGIYSLVVCQYISFMSLLLLVFYKIKLLNIFQLNLFKHIRFRYVKVFLLFALPFFLPYFVGQCNMLIEKWLAGSLGEGKVSLLDYARQFTAVLQSVLGSILSTVMMPMLAKSYAQKDSTGFNKIFRENLIVCFAIMALVIPVLCGAAQPLCEFFFKKGKVSVDTLQIIVDLSRMYAVAFVGVILYVLFGNALLASNKGKQYALSGVLAQVLVIFFNLLFVRFYGIYIFPLSMGVVHLVSAVIMSLLLKNDNIKMIYLKILQYSSIVFLLTVSLFLFNYVVVLNVNVFITLIVNGLLLILLFVLVSKGLEFDIKKYVVQTLHRIR